MTDYINRDDLLEAYSIEGGKRLLSPITLYMIAKEFPAADVIEQKHGQWKDSNYNLVWNADGVYKAAYQCSNCGACSPIVGYYCYNCGARMDGE